MGGNNKFIDKFSNVAMRVWRADSSKGTARHIRNDHATLYPGRCGSIDQQRRITVHFKRKCTSKCTVLGYCHYKWYIKYLRITCGTNRRYMLSQSKRFRKPIGSSDHRTIKFDRYDAKRIRSHTSWSRKKEFRYQES